MCRPMAALERDKPRKYCYSLLQHCVFDGTDMLADGLHPA
jgi:hypothetical protein